MSTLPPVEHSAICPYCGHTVDPESSRCNKCTGILDDFHRRLMQQHLGPWYLHKPHMAFRPGFSYSVLKDLVRKGTVEADSVVRGPTTRQYWMYAKDTPGVAHLLGICHACGQWVEPSDKSCPHCSRPFPSPDHRNYLGLDPDNHKLLTEAVDRERRRAAAARSRKRPAAPAGARAGGETDHDGDGVEAAEAGSADTLFELAAATSGFRQAPRQSPVPRGIKRGGPLLWTLLGVILFLLVVLIILVILAITGDGIDIFAEPVSHAAATAAGHVHTPLTPAAATEAGQAAVPAIATAGPYPSRTAVGLLAAPAMRSSPRPHDT